MTPLPRLMVAPNGATRNKADHPALPITIAEIIETARACHVAGADGLHAHVRDELGQHVLDAGLYRELLDEMALQVPGLPVQITTEAQGRYTPAEQRALVRAVRPRMVSIALREMLADSDTQAVARFYDEITEAKTSVQHILYDMPDVERLACEISHGMLGNEPIAVLLVLGRYADGKRAVPADLNPMLATLRALLPGADWAVCAFGPRETDCLLHAHTMGGKLRVGFENNLAGRDGRIAPDNASRVAEVARLTGLATTSSG